jgi:hypothetical protein
MATVAAHAHFGEVSIRTYTGCPECDVIVAFRGREMVVQLPDYDRALKSGHQAKLGKLNGWNIANQDRDYRNTVRIIDRSLILFILT